MNGFKKASRAILLVSLLALLAPLGCGDEGRGGDGGFSVTVTYGGVGRVVGLDGLEPAAMGVRLSDVVQATWPELDQGAVAADFIASDGFRPSQQSPCLDLVPVPGSLFAQGYLDAATADLTWDESLAFPGCLHPREVTTVVLLDLEEEGAMVTVEAGDAGVEVDLSLLPTVDVEGEPMVALDVVVSSSGAVEAPHLFDYDFEDSAGAHTTDGGDAPLTWDSLTSGWIHPATRDLAWDAALGLGAAWSLHDTAVIHLIAKENPTKSVLVVHDTDQAEVDLGSLPLVGVGEESLVLLQSVVDGAAIVADPSLYGYDFECSDGYTVVAGHDDRVPAAWTALGLGWIDPVSRNLTWDESLGYGSPWNANDVTIVHVLDQE